MTTSYPTNYQFCPMCGQAYTQKNLPLFEYHCSQCNYRVFENLNATGSGLIMRENHQEILLVQRAIEPHKGMWDIPGGFCNPNEHPSETVQRELQEELGVRVEFEKLWGVYAPVAYLFQNRTQYNCDIFYLGYIVSGEPQPADDVADFKWFKLSNIPDTSKIAFSSAQKALQELQENFLLK